jgi:hypothetical protein
MVSVFGGNHGDQESFPFCCFGWIDSHRACIASFGRCRVGSSACRTGRKILAKDFDKTFEQKFCAARHSGQKIRMDGIDTAMTSTSSGRPIRQ